MDSSGFTWLHLDSLGFTWSHLDSALVSRVVLVSRVGTTRVISKGSLDTKASHAQSWSSDPRWELRSLSQPAKLGSAWELMSGLRAYIQLGSSDPAWELNSRLGAQIEPRSLGLARCGTSEGQLVIYLICEPAAHSPSPSSPEIIANHRNCSKS